MLEIAYIAGIACVYLTARNTWVYRQRIKLLRERKFAAHESLPSYGYMLLCRPFCWDIQKFVRGEGDENTN